MSVLASSQVAPQAVPVPESKDASAGAGADGLALDDLKELMRCVNETTESLQATHATLQRQVARLQSELAEANDQLRRSRSLAALGEMAAGIAHEIRNPLGSIQLYAQMLGEDLADQPEQAALCEKIHRAVFGLDGVVRDVLLFARDMKFKPAPTTGGELMSQALARCESVLGGSAVEVTSAGPEDGSDELVADEGLMTQALGNVIRNAVEAMVEADASPRRLAVSVMKRRVRGPDGRRGQRIVFSVQDTGPGIPPEVVERMFNPFFTTRATGTGLGLAIVHRIVDAHGGHVVVVNAETGGAIVELCLPTRPPVGRPPKDNGFPDSADSAMALAHEVRDQVVKEDES